ncbi:hypothetical protein JCM3766R1_001780 [Sporobolomyces carnicolor]
MSTTTRPRSPSTTPPPSPRATEPLKKRPRLASSNSPLPYHVGMHLAPMVRIGTLPTRLVSLEYGASLVWGPEIVDKAIIGATREVDPNTGVVKFVKNNRAIFECHPVEKSRLIFQLGSADPELAVEALKVIEHDVAGVGLNCGCPKSFSLQGGMGAALLKDPTRLCNILKALVAATDLPIDAKIRLLPISAPSSPSPESESEPAPPAASEDPTLPLIREILSTGIKCLTVHCRTQTMRSSEPALHHRLLSINESLARLRREAQESCPGAEAPEWTKIPVVCNGDVTGGAREGTEEEGNEDGPDATPTDTWGNFDKVCRETGVASVMIARAAEANPSCFNSAGLEDPIKVVIPKMLRIAIMTKNHFSNTKYVLNAINLHHSPTPPGKELNRDVKLQMNKAKTYVDMGRIFGIDEAEIKRLESDATDETLRQLVPRWVERSKKIEASYEKGPGVSSA